MEKLTDILPNLIPPKFTPKQSNGDEWVLTEDEKESLIYFLIKRAKANLLYRLVEKGMPVQSAELVIAQKDWMQEIDIDAETKKANSRKLAKINELERYQKERQEFKLNETALRQKWDAKHFYETMKAYFIAQNGTFKAGRWNKDFIRAVCLMMANDGRYQSEMGFKPDRGMIVIGTAGLGKTDTFRAIANNPVNPIKIISIIEISEQVKRNGECELFTGQMICIDDVGSEPEVINHFGTKINWFKDFIEKYYLDYSDYSRLIITTNILPDEFEARYGNRVRSRMREMFNSIHLKGEDLRK